MKCKRFESKYEKGKIILLETRTLALEEIFFLKIYIEFLQPLNFILFITALMLTLHTREFVKFQLISTSTQQGFSESGCEAKTEFYLVHHCIKRCIAFRLVFSISAVA